MGIAFSSSKSKFNLIEAGKLKEKDSVRTVKMSSLENKGNLSSDEKEKHVKDEAQTGVRSFSSDGAALKENKNKSEDGAPSKPVFPQGEGSESFQSEKQSGENHMLKQENNGTDSSKTEGQERNENENKGEVCFSKEKLMNTTHQTCSNIEGKDKDNVTISTNNNEIEQSNLAKNEVPAARGDTKGETIPENSPQDSTKDQSSEVTSNSSINNEDDHKVATGAKGDAEEIDGKTAEKLSVNNKSGGSEHSNDANTETKEKAKMEETENKSSEHFLSDNLKFYRGEIASKPFPGERITEILKWKGDYRKLEYTHSYIQWLFPIPEGRGMNYSAQALQDHESEAIREDDELRRRVLEAYKMMLDFYGMELEDENTGKVKRGDNWKERYEHLNKSIHNYFRITRIIKALGELGLQHLQTPWLKFIMEEATVNKALPKLRGGSMDHWIGAIKDHDEQMSFYKLLTDLNEQMNKPEADDNKKDNKEEEGADTIHKNGLDNQENNAKSGNTDRSTGAVAIDQSDINDLNNPIATDISDVVENGSSDLGTRSDMATSGINEDGSTGSNGEERQTDKLENGSEENAYISRNITNIEAFAKTQNDTDHVQGESHVTNDVPHSDNTISKKFNEETDKNVSHTISPDQTNPLTDNVSLGEMKPPITSEIDENNTKTVDDSDQQTTNDNDKVEETKVGHDKPGNNIDANNEKSDDHIPIPFTKIEEKSMETKSSHEENIPVESEKQETLRNSELSQRNLGQKPTCGTETNSDDDIPYIDNEVQ